jgi:hypothetical protein
MFKMENNGNDKLKETGDIKKTGRVVANAVQFLNGEICSRNAKVPIILLDYHTPESAHQFAKGERFKLWIKLEEAQHRAIQEQLKKGLKEISIWFDEENRQKLKEFLQ